jgi:hypothetical protein
VADLPSPSKAPCGTCPYRRDVPAGIWSAEEYAKLPGYDGETGDQLVAGAGGLFFCHQNDGRLCAGWAGCHDMRHNLAVRLHRVAPETFTYKSPVPLFRSGAAAAAHGLSGIENPSPKARSAIAKLLKRLGGGDDDPTHEGDAG